MLSSQLVIHQKSIAQIFTQNLMIHQQSLPLLITYSLQILTPSAIPQSQANLQCTLAIGILQSSGYWALG